MSFLFRKKQSIQSLAEVLEDGHEMMKTEMKKPQYNNYSGPEVFIEVVVRVQPDNEVPYEGQSFKNFLAQAWWLRAGQI